MEKESTNVDAIIKGINDLSDAEKRELTIAIRTTTEGNKAYVSFLYGIGGTPPPKEEEPTEPCETHEHSEEGGENNNSENDNGEWL